MNYKIFMGGIHLLFIVFTAFLFGAELISIFETFILAILTNISANSELIWLEVRNNE